MGCALATIFPRELICEEVPVTAERFVLDFFVPSLRMVIECHGRQHYEHVPRFHGGRAGFHAQQDRDMRKRQWCELNNFTYVEVPYGTDGDGLLRIIRGENADTQGRHGRDEGGDGEVGS